MIRSHSRSNNIKQKIKWKPARRVTIVDVDPKANLPLNPSSSLCVILSNTKPSSDVLTDRVRLGWHETFMVPVRVADADAGVDALCLPETCRSQGLPLGSALQDLRR